MTGAPKCGKALIVEVTAEPGGCTLAPGTMERTCICGVVLQSEELGCPGAGILITGEVGLVDACIFMTVTGDVGHVWGALLGAVDIVAEDSGAAAAIGHSLVWVLLTACICDGALGTSVTV